MSNESGIVDLSEEPAQAGVVVASLTLAEPQGRLRVRLPAGTAGRAEAQFSDQSWAAKHYFTEGEGVVVYEFDEPLPAGPVSLRIPLVLS